MRVVIVASDLIAASARSPPAAAVARIVAEPDLVAARRAWHWCAGDATGHGGFLRSPTAARCPRARCDGRPPAGARAGAEARRSAKVALPTLHRRRANRPTHHSNDGSERPGRHSFAASHGTGTTRGAAAFAQALDLRARRHSVTSGRDPRARLCVRAALAIAARGNRRSIVALTLGEWGCTDIFGMAARPRWIAWRAQRGRRAAQAATPASAAAAIARRYMEAAARTRTIGARRCVAAARTQRRSARRIAARNRERAPSIPTVTGRSISAASTPHKRASSTRACAPAAFRRSSRRPAPARASGSARHERRARRRQPFRSSPRWWAGKSRAERRIVAGFALFVALVLGWWALWLPLRR